MIHVLVSHRECCGGSFRAGFQVCVFSFSSFFPLRLQLCCPHVENVKLSECSLRQDYFISLLQSCNEI